MRALVTLDPGQVVHTRVLGCRHGNESVPKITINDTIIFLSKTAINMLLTSNHNSFRVLLDKMLPYILFEKYINISASKKASSGNRHCVNCIGTLFDPYW